MILLRIISLNHGIVFVPLEKLLGIAPHSAEPEQATISFATVTGESLDLIVEGSSDDVAQMLERSAPDVGLVFFS